jgi:hypothetical protein
VCGAFRGLTTCKVLQGHGGRIVTGWNVVTSIGHSQACTRLQE